jgi:hypothetical protein
VVTSDARGNLATTDTNGLVAGTSVVQGLQHHVAQSDEGVAMALAMGGSVLPDDKLFALTTNWGTFQGRNAIGIAGMVRLTENSYLNTGVGAGLGLGTVGGRGGVTFTW